MHQAQEQSSGDKNAETEMVSDPSASRALERGSLLSLRNGTLDIENQRTPGYQNHGRAGYVVVFVGREALALFVIPLIQVGGGVRHLLSDHMPRLLRYLQMGVGQHPGRDHLPSSSRVIIPRIWLSPRGSLDIENQHLPGHQNQRRAGNIVVWVSREALALFVIGLTQLRGGVHQLLWDHWPGLLRFLQIGVGQHAYRDHHLINPPTWLSPPRGSLDVENQQPLGHQIQRRSGYVVVLVGREALALFVIPLIQLRGGVNQLLRDHWPGFLRFLPIGVGQHAYRHHQFINPLTLLSPRGSLDVENQQPLGHQIQRRSGYVVVLVGREALALFVIPLIQLRGGVNQLLWDHWPGLLRHLQIGVGQHAGREHQLSPTLLRYLDTEEEGEHAAREHRLSRNNQNGTLLFLHIMYQRFLMSVPENPLRKLAGAFAYLLMFPPLVLERIFGKNKDLHNWFQVGSLVTVTTLSFIATQQQVRTKGWLTIKSLLSVAVLVVNLVFLVIHFCDALKHKENDAGFDTQAAYELTLLMIESFRKP